jgi:hypothetical protein
MPTFGWWVVVLVADGVVIFVPPAGVLVGAVVVPRT